jgi:hypothetical protein
MNDLRRAWLDAEEATMSDEAVARARRRVAARLDAGPNVRRPRPWALAVAFAASALALGLGWHLLSTGPDGEPLGPSVVEVRPDPPPAPPAGFTLAPPPTTTASSGPDQEQGTLVAIAIGGQCEFFLDSEFMGRKSSFRKKVAVGKHVVECERPSGTRRRQTLRVKSDKPSIASFRIQDDDRWPDEDPPSMHDDLEDPFMHRGSKDPGF